MDQSRWRLAVVVAGLAMGSLVMGDTLFVAGSQRAGAKIRAYRNGLFEYMLDGRAVDPMPGERVSQIALDDDAALTGAEQAFAEEKWAAAAEGYQTALKATNRPWLKDWALPRMLAAADRAGKFDVAVSGFVQLVTKDPVVAMKHRPRLGEGIAAGALTAAAGELTKAAGGASLSATQKLALQTLLVDVKQAQGDLDGAAKLSEGLVKGATVDKADPASARVVADAYITAARVALGQKDYARAGSLIEQQKELIGDPMQQVEAFYCLAAAKDGQLGASPAKDAVKDVAIGYMRAVAVGRGIGERRYLPLSLLRVAELQEQLGDTTAAATLYGEVAAEYKDSPAAARAAARQQQLKSKSGT